MNNMQQTARVGLFFLLGLALVWVTFETLSDGKVFKDRGYTLVAGFENLKELKVGDEVRMAGVKIGEVHQTQLAGRRAEAILRIDSHVKIKNDAVATIAMQGSIGTNTINIYPGTGFGDRGQGRIRTLMASDADAIARETYADSVTPRVSTNKSILFNNIAVNAQISGVGADYFRVNGSTINDGTSFDKRSVDSRAQVAVIDTPMPRPPSSPMARTRSAR